MDIKLGVGDWAIGRFRRGIVTVKSPITNTQYPIFRLVVFLFHSQEEKV